MRRYKPTRTVDTKTSSKTKAPSSKRKVERWEIGWYVLFIFGPAVPIGFLAALFFSIYAATDTVFFLVLAILCILLYPLPVWWLIKTWRAAGAKASQTAAIKAPGSKPSSGSVTEVDLTPPPGPNPVIIGTAFLHGLFGKHHQSSSDTAFKDLFWQEKYRDHRDN